MGGVYHLIWHVQNSYFYLRYEIETVQAAQVIRLAFLIQH